MDSDTSLSIEKLSLFLIGVLVLILIQIVLAPLLWSPLRHFPGPVSAKISSLWLVLQSRMTRRSQAVMALHNQLGDFVRIAPNHISIADPAALQQIYGHKGGFLKGPFYDAFRQVRPVIFTSRNPAVHQRKRKCLNPAFSARNLKAFEPYMSSDILAFNSWVSQIADQKESTSCDMSQILNYLAFDVIANYSFGKPFGFLADREDGGDLVGIIDRRGETINALGPMSSWLRPVMKYCFFDTFWYKGLRAKANMEKYGREAYERRRSEGTGRQDLLSFLLDAKDLDSRGRLDSEEIVAESISVIIGGSDTTSSTMTNFVDIVSRRPEIQLRIQEELDSAFPGPLQEDWVADADTTDRLPLLIATLREVMRFRPTSSTGLERVCPPDGITIADTFIPGGTLVSVPTLNIMMDERVFKDPLEFNPNRWLQPDCSTLLEFFHPFSLGPRSCIGRNFAWMEMTKAMATLFRLFEVARVRDEATVVREGFFVKSVECWVDLKKRPRCFADLA